tara:strand:+ start:487 stop:1737 length:1251 start_codon:yes stop_codon:yes gene_type:complete
MYYIVPIFSDPYLHPLHKDNGLSFLYVQDLDLKKEPFYIIQKHPDSNKFLEDYKWLKEEMIVTPDAKTLLHIYPFDFVIDLNAMWWLENNKPFNMDSVRNNAIDFLSNKYYNVKKLNEIIPLIKHKEYCRELVDKMTDVTVGNDGYMVDVVKAYSSIEKNGIKVSDDVCDIFDIRVKKHISDGKLYSNYNLWTTTGRPSNSFGSVNFAALPPEKRKAFIPENDYLVEFDFDAYHLRLIADLVGYHTFDENSVHQHLADWYGCSYEESKQRSFKLLYGGIDKETREKVPFFDLTYKYINSKWNEINTHNLVYTDIYRRKLIYANYEDINRNKLFNYLIQALETESNIKKILSIQDYLLEKKTKLVLYGYDSFLFDFSNQDGVETLREIKSILEENKHYTKSKMGKNYGEMEDITKRL